MGLGLAIFGRFGVPIVIVIIGIVLVLIGAPKAGRVTFEIHPGDGQAWLNLSTPFWGSGSLSAVWFNFADPHANITVFACESRNCSVPDRTALIKAPADFEIGYVRGLAAHEYLVRAENLTTAVFGNLTFDFNWSVSPWVASMTPLQGWGLGFTAVGIPWVLIAFSRVQR